MGTLPPITVVRAALPAGTPRRSVLSCLASTHLPTSPKALWHRTGGSVPAGRELIGLCLTE